MKKEKVDRAEDWIDKRHGFATCEGRLYILVERCTRKDPSGGGRVINAVAADARQTTPGYYPMTLLHLPKKWRRGEAALAAEPNGEYDWILMATCNLR